MKRRKVINRFVGKYYFLSNFYLCEIEWHFKLWPSVEQIFQASKTWDFIKDGYHIRNAPTCMEAKRLGRQVKLREDWEQVKDDIMYLAVYQKFYQNIDLENKLLNTGIKKLVEGNRWHDNYWGDCACHRCKNIKGKNQLGKILMRARARLKANRRLKG